MDQAVEETINKDTQTAMAPRTSNKFLGQAQGYVQYSYHDLKSSRIEKDEGSIQAIVDLLEND